MAVGTRSCITQDKLNKIKNDFHSSTYNNLPIPKIKININPISPKQNQQKTL